MSDPREAEPLTPEELDSLSLLWEKGMGQSWHAGSYRNCIARLLATIDALQAAGRLAGERVEALEGEVEALRERLALAEAVCRFVDGHPCISCGYVNGHHQPGCVVAAWRAGRTAKEGGPGMSDQVAATSGDYVPRFVFEGVVAQRDASEQRATEAEAENARLRKALGEQTEAVKKWRNREATQRKRRRREPKCHCDAIRAGNSPWALMAEGWCPAHRTWVPVEAAGRTAKEGGE